MDPTICGDVVNATFDINLEPSGATLTILTSVPASDPLDDSIVKVVDVDPAYIKMHGLKI
jgi:hypothetical protein